MMNWRDETTDQLCEAILTLKTKEECYAFLDDLCTIKEIQDMSQRFAVALLLNQKINYINISQKTGASTATISRVSKCFEFGSGGYKKAIERLEENKQ